MRYSCTHNLVIQTMNLRFYTICMNVIRIISCVMADDLY